MRQLLLLQAVEQQRIVRRQCGRGAQFGQRFAPTNPSLGKGCSPRSLQRLSQPLPLLAASAQRRNETARNRPHPNLFKDSTIDGKSTWPAHIGSGI